MNLRIEELMNSGIEETGFPLAPRAAIESKGIIFAPYTNLRSSEYQKKLKSSGSFAPRTLTSFGFALTHWTGARPFKFAPDLLRGRTPAQLRCSIWRCGGRPASAGQPPPAPSAWPRARTRAAKSCGVRGSHFPALFDYFNLERNFVSKVQGPGRAKAARAGNYRSSRVCHRRST